MNKICIVLALLCNHFCLVHAQNNQASLTLEQRDFAQSYYGSMIGKSSVIYLGKKYIDYDLQINGHQYFKEDVSVDGEVMFKGLSYRDILLKFDIHKEMVIFCPEDIVSEIVLGEHNVEWFKLLDKKFVNISADSMGIAPGYYQEAFAGEKITFLIKRFKRIKETIDQTETTKEFLEEDRFYLCQDGQCTRIRTKAGVLKLLASKKKELKSYIRKQGIYFQHNLEAATLAVSEYYDQL